MNGGGGADGLILFYYIQTEAEVEEKEGVRLGQGGWWQYKGGYKEAAPQKLYPYRSTQAYPPPPPTPVVIN